MHMAPRAAAWVAWAVWTCNTGNQLVTVKRERTSVRSFFFGCDFGAAYLAKTTTTTVNKAIAVRSKLWPQRATSPSMFNFL
ncbi:MAG: hypothetical protein QOD95_2349 [Gammaproteobacteria bacterium]|jgi:hypothetical protein|nr:hypothetical protein [Gammaproteobacteria bacterium]